MSCQTSVSFRVPEGFPACGLDRLDPPALGSLRPSVSVSKPNTDARGSSFPTRWRATVSSTIWSGVPVGEVGEPPGPKGFIVEERVPANSFVGRGKADTTVIG